jgi:POT family proton-dependent oligopeptide transporter
MNQEKINSLHRKYLDIMPPGAGVLFFVQMFSTIAFSVLYSSLVLYTTAGLKLSDSMATGITASFVAFNYALHLLGGYIGGRYFSYRVLFSIGMIGQFTGCILLAIETTQTFYWGLATFLTGSGLNITCINCMLTQLFKPDDKRREAAFLWNYSGMNIGFFAGFAISGYFQLHHAYHELFLFSSIGNLIALAITLIKWKKLVDIDTSYSALAYEKKSRANITGMVMIAALLVSLQWLLGHAQLSNNLILATGVVMMFVIAALAMKQPTIERRNKIWAYLLLALTSLVFWTLYLLAPMGLTLFVARNVDLHFYGISVAPQWTQNINTIVIILGGPLLSTVFSALRERNIRLTIPVQFAIALILIGASLCILPLGIYFADAEGYTSFSWIIISFILQSSGELFISPIGYAMVGQLTPPNLQGIMMGTWLLITGVGAALSGYFSNIALGTTQSTNPLVTNSGFSHTFGLLGLAAIIVGIALFICVPLMLRLTHEKKLFAKEQAVVPTGV